MPEPIPPARPASYDKKVALVLQGGGALGSYASGALPPGFPPVEIDGEHYWDGGLSFPTRRCNTWWTIPRAAVA